LQNGLPQKAKEVPTLAEFAPRCLDGYARANRQKASGIAAKETILRVHLGPSPGAKRLDAITNEVVQSVKRSARKIGQDREQRADRPEQNAEDRYRMGGTGSNAMLDPFVALSVCRRYGPRVFKTFPLGVPSSDRALSLRESVAVVQSSSVPFSDPSR